MTRLIVLLFCVFVTPGIAAASSLQELLDHPFDTLADGDVARLRSYLRDGDPLVLILWNSDCPKCLENVSQADALRETPGARLLGVNNDPSRWDALGFVNERGIETPQLHDPAGLLAEALGATGISFSFFVLDDAGGVLADSYDSVPDARAEIESVLGAVLATHESRARVAPRAVSLMSARPAARRETLRHSGRARVRWLGVGVDDDLEDGDCACAIGGAFGEPLSHQAKTLFRLDYEIEARVSPELEAGALLRISNEDPVVLETGPRYLSSEFGSVFVEYRRGEWTGRAGYYAVSFTPLTLMRWDFADNPPSAGADSLLSNVSGGSGSCGCGGASRGLNLDALDDLGPAITFEGARIRARPRAWADLQILYARPRTAKEIDVFDAEQFAYRQDLFGARALLSGRPFGGPPTRLSLNHVSSRDDPDSSDWFLGPEDPASFPHSNAVSSLNLAADLPGGLIVDAELARSYRRTDRIDAEGEGRSAWGSILELSYEAPRRAGIAAAYLNLERGFASDFGALSYLPNSEGFRVSAELLAGDWGLSLFHKELTRQETPDPEEISAPLELDVSSALLSYKPGAKSALDLMVTRNAEKTCGEPCGGCACYNWVWSLSLRHELARRAHLLLELSKIRAEPEPEAGRARADMGSLLLSVDF